MPDDESLDALWLQMAAATLLKRDICFMGQCLQHAAIDLLELERDVTCEKAETGKACTRWKINEWGKWGCWIWQNADWQHESLASIISVWWMDALRDIGAPLTLKLRLEMKCEVSDQPQTGKRCNSIQLAVTDVLTSHPERAHSVPINTVTVLTSK